MRNSHMQTEQPVSPKQGKKNKADINESETAIIGHQEAKDTHEKGNLLTNKLSSTVRNNSAKFQGANRQQKKLKQSKIHDYKPAKKTEVRPIPNKIAIRSTTPGKNNTIEQQKDVEHSQSSNSSESSSDHQKLKTSKDAAINSKNVNLKKVASSTSNSEDSDISSSKQNKSAQKKPFAKDNPPKELKNVGKDSKKIQMAQSTILKKPEQRQKKQKGSDDQSDYAPSLREGSKSRKTKPVQKKQKENSSDQQKIAAVSNPKIAPKKGILKNDLSFYNNDKLQSKNKDQSTNQKQKEAIQSKNEDQNNSEPLKQRSLRKKKPVSYKHMDGELSDQEMGEKVPYRGRFKSIEMNPEPIVTEIKPQQSQQKPVKPKQVQEKMNFEHIEQQKEAARKDDNDKEEKIKLSKDKKPSIKQDNSKMKAVAEIKHELPAQKLTPHRSRQQYQKIHQIKTKNLSLQSRIIVQSVIVRVRPMNTGFNLGQAPPQQIQKQMKLLHGLFQHAPCCPFSIEGHIRKKKIQEGDELQEELEENNKVPVHKQAKPKQTITQEEHQNHEEIADFSAKRKLRGKKLQDTKMEQTIATITAANNKNGSLLQGSSMHDKKQTKSKAFNDQAQDQEQILVKRSTKRLRQKKTK